MIEAKHWLRLRNWLQAPGLMPWTAILIILTAVIAGVGADFAAPHSPTVVALADRLLPPAWMEGGSPSHLLGTDQLGRDILSRLIHGSRASLTIAALTLVVAGGVGLGVGLIAGYFAGRVDMFLMRLVDATLSIPLIMLALLFAVIGRPSLANIVIAVALVLWARFARVIRGEVLSLRERDYVKLARVAGASHARIMWRHILPNAANTFMVLATLQVGYIILVEASLSFLGAGIPPPTPSWGSMIAGGRELVTTAWWLSVIPGVATMLIVLAFNILGDWLRDVLDPRYVE